MVRAQTAGTFDRRMRQIAGSVVFEEVGEQVEAALGLGQGGFWREVWAMREREALHAFDDIGTARKPARREARRQQPILRRLAGVKRLAHRAELRFEPGRLRPGDAERDGGRLGVEAEQLRACRRGPEAADRAGRMEAEIVMPRPQRRADSAGGLVTGDKGGRDLTARAALRLGERKQ